MKNKKLLVVLVSGLLAVILGIVLFPAFEKGYMGNTETVVQVVSKIERGMKITEDMVQEIEFPTSYLGEQEVLPLDRVIGKYASVTMEASDIVTGAKIASDNESVFFEKNNLIAVSVSNLSASVAAKLSPGDRVNVYGFQGGTGGGIVLQPEILKNMEIAYVVSTDALDISAEDQIIPGTVVFKITNPEQGRSLVELEYSAKIHLERVSAGK